MKYFRTALIAAAIVIAGFAWSRTALTEKNNLLGFSENTALSEAASKVGSEQEKLSLDLLVPTACTTAANTAAITIPSSGTASPYPSNVTVAGLTGTVTKVTVKLNGFGHTFPSDVDILLVGPGGQNTIILSDVGGSTAVSGLVLTLDDSSAIPMSAAPLTSGTYRPTNISAGDSFPSPAPVPTSVTAALSAFNGTSPNGTWSLYVVDAFNSDGGSLSGGWELSIDTTTCTGPSPSPSPPIGTCVAPPANMISWWSADGDANDIKGTNHGGLQGGATATATGKVGQAFSFNGTTGYVSLGNPASLKLSGAITIDAWINPSAMPAENTLDAVMTKWGQDFSTGPNADSYGLWTVNRGGTLKLFSAVHFISGAEPNIEGGTIPLNQWSHVAMTYEPANTTFSIYINGVLVSTQSQAGSNPLHVTDRAVAIGKEESSLPRFFAGMIDEVEIFSRALAQSEIQAIYNAGAAGKCKTGQTPTPTPSPSPPTGGTLFENFDSVTAPSLPAGWTATTITGCAGEPSSARWVTSTSGTPSPPWDTSPNALFANSPSCISDEVITSPAYLVSSTSASVNFRRVNSLESGFDGAVLEVSINGGAFQDILVASATFGAGGYDSTINSGTGNPIGGRLAWTGNSFGYVTTIVNLPVSANGQNWAFRFRRATDSSVGVQGVRIDSITSTGVGTTPSPTLTPTPTPSPTPPLVVQQHLTTAGPIPDGCGTPPVKTSFHTLDATVLHWTSVSGSQTGSIVRVEWVQPNGSIFRNSQGTINNTNPNICFWDGMDIAGTAAAQLPGNWQVRVFYNDSLITTDNFTISAPPPPTVFEHVTTPGPIPDGCGTPTARTSFTTLDPTVLQWTSVTGNLNGSVVRWEWVQPNGSIFKQFDATINNTNSNICFFDGMSIAGTPAAQLIGNWQVRVFYNGVLIVTDNFTISAPPPPTVFEHLTTAGPIPNGCATPTAKTTFTTLDATVLQWTSISGNLTGSVVRWEWVQPNGSIFKQFTGTIHNTNSNICFFDGMSIAGTPAAELPGNWQVRVFYNGVLIATDNFTITAVPPPTVFEHLTTAGPIPNGCSTPVAKTSFAATDATVLQWTSISGHQNGSVVRWEWVQPNGTIFKQFQAPINNTNSNICFWDGMSIAGTDAAGLPGNWQVRVFYNGILLATDTFTIGTGGPPTADCGKPIAALTTSNTSRSVVFFPDALASNTPQQRVVGGLPGFGSGGPQGLAFYGADHVLVADAENLQASEGIFVFQVSTGTKLHTINLGAGYIGAGTVAVAPDESAALAMGGNSTLFVVRAPFNASSAIERITLPAAVGTAQTQAIVFNGAGRAFVAHPKGVSVLDPPYNSVAFEIPSKGQVIAITPDGNTLLLGDGDSSIHVFKAPFSGASVGETLALPTAVYGMMVTPDGTKAIAAGFPRAAYAISAPFTSSSTVESLPLPPSAGPTSNFEDVGISGDGQLAILAGGGSAGEPPVFIRAPFTAAGAQSYFVPIEAGNPGRGHGSVRFQPACSGGTGTGTTGATNGKIAFVGYDEHISGEIYLIDPDGSALKRLTDNNLIDSEPAWSPDGTKIAYTRPPALGDEGEIYVMNGEGKLPTRLTPPALGTRPAWSPDGTKIAFESIRDGTGSIRKAEIYVMNADGSNQVNLTNNPEADNYPTWSPDGTKIAFASGRNGNAEIYVMNPDGTALNRLNTPTLGTQPAWSPDGTKIAFTKSAGGNDEIFIMNSDGSNQTNITMSHQDEDNASWSPDGKKIVFTRPDNSRMQIFVKDVDGTSVATQITTNGGTHPHWGRVPTVGTPTPGGGCFAPPLSLTNWYRGQGNADDSRGTANGTATPSVTYPASGKVGQAFGFDGAQAPQPRTSVTLPTLNLGSNFSVEFWLNPARDAGYQHLISNSYNGAPPNFGALYIVNNKLVYQNRDAVINSNAVIPLNEWTHAALVYDGSKMNLYVNGVFDGSSSPFVTTFNNPLKIGDGINPDSSNTFQGMLDEVSFYNTALTAGDVLAIFNSGGEGKCTGGNPVPTPGGPPGLTADYQFQNTRASSGGGPDLTDIITGGNGANSFAMDTVPGCAPRTVLNFPKGNGLSLATNGLTTDNKTYSIVMLFKFAEQDSSRAIVDFKNGLQFSRGIYADVQNNLRFDNSTSDAVGVGVGTGSPIKANKYVQVVLTRQGTDVSPGNAGIETGYVDGELEYRLDHANADGIIHPQFNMLRFFNNPGNAGPAYSAGSVARIRIFNRVLTPEQVAALDKLPGETCTNPGPSPMPTLSIVNTTAGAEPSAPNVFTVTLSGQTTSQVTVNYATANGTATAGSDYTATSGTLTFLANTTTLTQTITVPTLDDLQVEGTENFTLTLSAPTNTTISGTNSAIGTIADNETQPTLSIVNTTAGAEPSAPNVFTVALSGQPTSQVTVNYATANGLATAGSDYTASSGTLTFLANTTTLTQTITVPTLDDLQVEGTENFTLTLSAPTNATISGTNPAIGTIADNETQPPTSCATSADYQLQGTRSSSVGGALELTDIGVGSNTFATDTVNGVSRLVLQFPQGNGGQLQPTTGTIANDAYTIVALVKFANADGFRRVLEFKNGTSDTGVYISNGFLTFYSGFGTGPTPIPANTYVQIVLTRTAAGAVTAYLNGVQQFSFVDSNNLAVIDSNNALRFFKDNTSGGAGGEESAGSVARIRLYNCVLTATEIAALGLNPTATPPTGTVTFPGTNLGAIPDGSCAGEGRQIQFPVSGVTGPLSDIRVSMTGTHPYVGDLDALLIDPDNTASEFLFTFTGNDLTPQFGDSSDLNGTYTFFDSAPNNWWTAAAAVDGLTAIAPGNYKPSNAIGNIISLDAAFANVDPNGIWILKVNDCWQNETGAITGASLRFDAAEIRTTISGRVLTPTGTGLRNARVTLVDAQGVQRSTTTSTLGFYAFDMVRIGEQYRLTAASRRYRFDPKIETFTSGRSDLDFVGLE